jgi:hypothetical protein
MAITTKTVTLGKVVPGKTFYARSFSSTDISGCEEILAAHATKPYYVTRLDVGFDADGIYDFGDGESSSAVETVALQLLGTATGLVWNLRFKDNPIKLTAAKGITIDGASGNVAGYLECYTVD